MSVELYETARGMVVSRPAFSDERHGLRAVTSSVAEVTLTADEEVTADEFAARLLGPKPSAFTLPTSESDSAVLNALRQEAANFRGEAESEENRAIRAAAEKAEKAEAGERQAAAEAASRRSD